MEKSEVCDCNADLSTEEKKNCWEIMGCGRGPGGGNGGLCPAASASLLNGVHNGINGGRACWVVAGTLCNGAVSGTFAKKMENCFTCPFYRQIRREETDLKSHQELLVRIRKA